MSVVLGDGDKLMHSVPPPLVEFQLFETGVGVGAGGADVLSVRVFVSFLLNPDPQLI